MFGKLETIPVLGAASPSWGKEDGPVKTMYTKMELAWPEYEVPSYIVSQLVAVPYLLVKVLPQKH